MHVSTSLVLRTVIAGTLLSMASLAQAADGDDNYVSAMRYVSLDVSGDNNSSRQYSGTGSFTLGRYVWLDGTAGKLTNSSDDTSDNVGDLTNYGAGFGLKNEHVQFRLNFLSSKNSDSYKQNDVTAALDWNSKRYGFGIDGFHRKTTNGTSVPNPYPRLGPSTLHGDANQTGNGVGLHASFNLTEQLSLSLGGMKYSYNDLEVTTNVRNTPTQSELGTLLQSVRDKVRQELQLQATSGLTRSLALLESSYNAGLSYQFDAVGLNAQYLRDKALDTGEITDTYLVGASIFVSSHWMLSPSLGESKSDTAGNVTFGGLSVSYNW
jgi:hypothetical protein